MERDDCAICQRADVAAIDAAIRSGMPPPQVARRFGVSALAVFTHRRHVEPSKPKPPAVEPAPEPSSDAAPVEPVEPPKPKPAPKRAPIARDWDAARYRRVWTMQPHIIARSLTPAERCDPSINPFHPNASSEPPECALRRMIGPDAGGTSFAAMEARRRCG